MKNDKRPKWKRQVTAKRNMEWLFTNKKEANRFARNALKAPNEFVSIEVTRRF
jgi:hypothetical protein